MSGQILPPREPIADVRVDAQTGAGSANITPSWYRYLVSRKAITDAISTISNLVVGAVPSSLPNARQVAVAAPITAADAGEGLTYTLGLADTTVVAATYGSASKTVSFTVDSKGRLTAAAEYALSTSNITEGLKLFYTDLRARSALVPSARLSINTATGAIDTVGFSGTVAPVASITVVNGIVTNVA